MNKLELINLLNDILVDRGLPRDIRLDAFGRPVTISESGEIAPVILNQQQAELYSSVLTIKKYIK